MTEPIAKPLPSISADNAIVSVHANGFVDTDGAKLSSIDVKYNVDMRGADVSLAKYAISDYGILGTLDSAKPDHPPTGPLMPDSALGRTGFIHAKPSKLCCSNVWYTAPQPKGSALFCVRTRSAFSDARSAKPRRTII